MNNRIIDASNRFPARRSKACEQDPLAHEATKAARQRQEAEALRTALVATPRLNKADRAVLARNIGRAIERSDSKKRPTQIASQLFRTLYGEEGGASKEKKRKRYIRFEGERLSEQEMETLAARGSEFLRLIEGLADLKTDGRDPDIKRNQMLLFVCDGTSFSGPNRPRIDPDIDLRDLFQTVMDQFLDKIARETDIIEYLEEMQKYSVRTHPHTRDDCTDDLLERLHLQTFPVERFEHAPNEDKGSYADYSRLRLYGFDPLSEAPSRLFPEMRIARLYVPRRVLCFSEGVKTEDIQKIRKHTPSAEDLKALQVERNPESVALDELTDWVAEKIWRTSKEYDLWKRAILRSGADPETLDWASFDRPTNELDELHGTTNPNVEWRIFWQTMNVDLHLTAEGSPDALRFALSFNGVKDGHWTHATRELAHPHFDDIPKKRLTNSTVLDLENDYIPWVEDGGFSYPCRGISHFHYAEDGEYLWTDDFEEPQPLDLDFLESKVMVPLHSQEAWNLLTAKMKDWTSYQSTKLYTRDSFDPTLSLRILFEAPEKWTLAPDGSLAGHILSNLAHGQGGDRLDQKIISNTNNLIECFKNMIDEKRKEFKKSLSENGYILN
ncbi:hypothetical protein [Donghicola eburneus]|uniref:hypothetical protein n=1 Tax=Donghicola eburneus TaxID=393278 RepID=UPI0008E32BB2|nr:hypothetical protein [Donghicola eburneus]SFQ77658.1 hypothetical protein SAMN05421764_1201 [Donghicola eburneus]